MSSIVRTKELFPMMPYSTKLCRIVGFWSDASQPRAHWRVYAFEVLFTMMLIIPGTVFIIRQDTDLVILLKATFEVVSFFMFDIRFLVHVSHCDTLKACYYELQEALTTFVDSPHEDVRGVLKKLQQVSGWSKYYHLAVFCQIQLYGPVGVVASVVMYMIGKIDVEDLPNPFIEVDYLFFNHRSSFWMWLLIAVISVLLEYAMLTLFVTNETTHWGLLYHVSGLFKIIGMELTRLDACVDADQYINKLGKLVEIHEAGYRCAARLEHALHNVVALLYGFCITQICYIMFVMTLTDDVFILGGMIFVAQYLTFMIFSFSMFSNEMMDTSTSLTNIIYGTRWYERSAREMQCVFFVLMRTQKGVAITAGKFFPISRRTFAMAMRNAVSYLALMRQFYGDS
ncbi:uncharacterized protein LOC129738197 [Uranotaenia lowii]|uniref:uncharacterized protein LOC129738197 n=1 Tax=Uranotaenia lowii TaxID=190385 RepID=UPI002478F5CF|nr:uncharacterized protein LOC129738197 [Uranotaenia lowii]